MLDVKPEVNIKVGGKLSREVYSDLFKPTSQNIGKTFGDLTRIAYVVLGKSSEIVADKLDNFLESFAAKAEKRIQEIPEDQRVEPTIPSRLRITSNLPKVIGEPLLEDIFLNVLLSSMDKRAARDYFSYFPETVASLSSDEAKILKFLASHQENSVFAKVSIYSCLPNGTEILAYRNVSMLGEDAGCDFPVNAPAYLDNLSRLGLIDMLDELIVGADAEYKRIMQKIVPAHLPEDNPRPESYDPKHFDQLKGLVRLSSLGVSFCRACKIYDPSSVSSAADCAVAHKPLILRNRI